MIAYPAMLDVPRELVTYVSRLLAAERRARGTRCNSGALSCRKQALFVLVRFRKREDIPVLGAGFSISRATAYRYHDEAVRVLAEQASDLHEVLEQAAIVRGACFDHERWARLAMPVYLIRFAAVSLPPTPCNVRRDTSPNRGSGQSADCCRNGG